MFFNKKNLTVLFIATGLGFSGVAMSATNAQITVTGNIAAATCDLIVSNTGIDLGTFISSDIKAAGVIAGSTRAFDMSLSNCGKAFDGKDGKFIQMHAKGTALATNTALFNSIDKGTVGVEVTADGKPVKPNSTIPLESIKTVAQNGSAVIPMTVALNSTMLQPGSQRIEAPITFSVSYE